MSPVPNFPLPGIWRISPCTRLHRAPVTRPFPGPLLKAETEMKILGRKVAKNRNPFPSPSGNLHPRDHSGSCSWQSLTESHLVGSHNSGIMRRGLCCIRVLSPLGGGGPPQYPSRGGVLLSTLLGGGVLLSTLLGGGGPPQYPSRGGGPPQYPSRGGGGSSVPFLGGGGSSVPFSVLTPAMAWVDDIHFLCLFLGVLYRIVQWSLRIGAKFSLRRISQSQSSHVPDFPLPR